eukprot:6518692-Pyramimonas_sp.AAC.1
MGSFGSIPRELGADFDAHIDDLILSCIDAAKVVIPRLVAGARALHRAVTETLGRKLAMDKVGIVSS